MESTTALPGGFRDRAVRLVGAGLVRPSALLLFAAAALIGAAAILLRLPLFPFVSGDYAAYVGRWYSFMAGHGGFLALRYDFANYNAPYLYLVAAITYLPLPPIDAIKLISVSFDYLLAFSVYRIVSLRHQNRWLPLLAGGLVLLLPTVVVNSSMWGQADSIYAALGLAGLDQALRRRSWAACLLFGLAFAFKLQIVFAFPVLLLLVLGRRIRWPWLLLIPAAYVLTDLPAVLLGASPRDLLAVYLTQTGTYQELTLNAPNLYQFLGGLPDTEAVLVAATAVTGVVVLALIAAALWSRAELTTTRIVLAMAVSVVLVPYLLPAMHERYFYLADAMCVIAAFYVPRWLFFLPPLEQFASALSYVPFLSMSMGGAGGSRNFGPGSGSRSPGGGRPGGGSGFAPGHGGRGFPGHTPSGGGRPHHALAAGSAVSGTSWVSFELLALAMLAVLVGLLWVTVWEFRRGAPRVTPPERAEAATSG
ncbi:MAG TPA: hypothetical protein VIA06_19345 [Candidatus Dormibacteraeota bacterium]|jgi:Gpi18-like mannosyltransferase|nr:hypothetical protein [Candidatus Dormibacteraeota bacterium]